MHGACKVASSVLQEITQAVINNPSLLPTDVSKGKGLKFVPSAVDGASAHLGKVSRIVTNARKLSPAYSSKWSVEEFETIADEIDSKDEQYSGDDGKTRKEFSKLGRPYLRAVGIEDGVKYILTMSPLMCDILCSADFLEADVTYNENTEYKYLFNLAAFNSVTMEWMVVARTRMTSESAEAYKLAFEKIFSLCKSRHHDFAVHETIKGIVIDWSAAEMKGLKLAIGDEHANKLLKGCRVHWIRSCQRVCDRICKSSIEKNVFKTLSTAITCLKKPTNIIACFQALCGERSVASMTSIVTSLNSKDAKYVDKYSDWSAASHWASWWSTEEHLRMLCLPFSEMTSQVWTSCPSTSNAVERKNAECKEKHPLPLKAAMINVYNIDRAVCCKHIAALKKSSISYRSKTDEARAADAQRRKKERNTKPSVSDPQAMWGPPDKKSNFNGGGSKSVRKVELKRNHSHENDGETPPSKRKCTGLVGKQIEMEFANDDGSIKW